MPNNHRPEHLRVGEQLPTTPYGFAQRLSGYIACPQKIHAYTKREFGRGPSLAECERMVEQAGVRRRLAHHGDLTGLSSRRAQ